MKQKGLQNLGNTCYLNSGLQLVFACLAFNKYFLKGNFKNQILREYQLTLQDYQNESGSYISPQSIKKIVGKKNSIFRGFDQNDSQEFMIYLLDILEMEVQKSIKDGEIPETIELVKGFPPIKMTNYVSRFFDTITQTQIRCQDCHNVSLTSHKHRFLIFHMLNEKEQILPSLSQGLDTYFLSEELSDDNQVECDKCKKKTDSIKKSIPQVWPKYLLVMLKRYAYTKRGACKVTAEIDAPLVWEHPVFKGKKYGLRGMVHQSGGMKGGHYISYLQNKDQWYCLNDSRVSNSNESEALKTARRSYLYLYYKIP